MKTWPTLYKKTKTGKVQQWTIKVSETTDGYGCIIVSHGKVNGKLQENQKVIECGKNLGKKNETSPHQQAILEAGSKFQRQKDKGYTETPTGVSKKLLPMLAKDYHKHGHHITYPAYLQPKYNGVRCMAVRKNGTVTLYSRQGKSYNNSLRHILEALNCSMEDGQVIDGEIYVHGWTFQEIIRAVKKYDPDVSPKLKYYVYDMPSWKGGFFGRRSALSSWCKFVSSRVFYMSECYLVAERNDDDLKSYHDNLVKSGYEGLIIRNANGEYEYNTRSNNLQKYKMFHDKEVLIIGCKEGTGLEKGCVVWEVLDEFGNKFWSRPRGSRDLRRRWFKDAYKYMGCELTIRYQELSEDNVPVFNVGISIRDYE
jgi:DNA ligase-1